MKEIEIIEKRKPREKHFLKENGLIVANLYDDDVHFLKNGKYEDIDNTLVEEEGYYTNTDNAYKVWFGKNPACDLMQMESEEHYLNIKLKENAIFTLKQENPESKWVSGIDYLNILENIDLDYKVLPRQVKENIVLHDRNVDVSKIKFEIDTNLKLKVNVDKSISALDEDKIIFHIDTPFMIDQNQNVCNKVYYNLDVIDNKYQLTLVVDEQWLYDEKTVYPVIIDPTITNYGQDNSVYDTYIYPGDTSVDRNSKDYLKVGVEKSNSQNVINRSLIKFELPTIGTGSQVIDAQLQLYAYPDLLHTPIEITQYGVDTVNVHRITENWDEQSANWNSMNTKFDTRVEGTFQSSRSSYYNPDDGTTSFVVCGTDLTSLVRKWYTDTPNYGILLKLNTETYKHDIIPMFFSKNNTISGGNPKPLLVITYRNQNGLESYMDYQQQNFAQGQVYHNTYNGNLTTIFNIGATIQGKMPVQLKLVYNTNDVVLGNNIGYGLGYRLNLGQTIQEQTIDNIKYLAYTDEDGTIHYFLNQKTKFDENSGFITSTYENTFFDEDGLDLVIESSNTYYILKDKKGNQMQFTISNGIGYLSEKKDVNGNQIVIAYDASHRITNIKDANNSEINLTYTTNQIIVTSPDQKIILNYNGNNLIDIESLMGTTMFTNVNNLITSITDVTGKKIAYKYYEQSPYKLKKVTEYGTAGGLGNYYDTIYGFNSTSIIDSKNRVKTLIFNNYGNPVSVSSLKDDMDITNAYGVSIDYGETFNNVTTYTNKLLGNQIPIKYVKNYLSDSSFESGIVDFEGVGLDGHVNAGMGFAHIGNYSLLIRFGKTYQTHKSVTVPKGNYYTFSAYCKSITGDIGVYLEYIDATGKYVTVDGEVTFDDDYTRHDITIYYPETATSDLTIGFKCNTRGECLVDDIQLEQGQVVNNYNILENSDFSDGLDQWNISAYDSLGNEVATDNYFDVINITNNQKALKLKMNPEISTSFSQNFKVSGKAGEVYNLSFWYKNEGLRGYEGMGADTMNNIIIGFIPTGDIYTDDVYNRTLNPNEKEWQYFSQSFTAKWDFKEISVSFLQGRNANDFYITNLNLFRDIRNTTYDYDDNGNIILSKDLNDEVYSFNYDKNNKLIQMLDSKGKNFVFEYDNINTNKVLRGIANNGVSNEIEYDSFNNPIISRVIDRGYVKELSNGIYKIRLKGTNKELRMIKNNLTFSTDSCGHDKWYLEKVVKDNTNYYKIKHSIISNKYISIVNNSVVLLEEQGDSSLFKIVKKANGSYTLQNKVSSSYLKYENNLLISATLNEDDENFEFYFESVTNGKFIENSIEYTSDGKFVKSMTDTFLHKTLYDYDTTSGLLKSVTNTNGQQIFYTYNNKNQLSSISVGDKIVNYHYDAANLISKISQDGREYTFDYDEFLNLNTVKIGNNITLVTNQYESNNGNLLSTNYGNNQAITYEYDEFDRIKTVHKMDDEYKYIYGNNGDLMKIISNHHTVKYDYNLSKRLSKYQYDDFKILYRYNSDGDITSRDYVFDNIVHPISNYYNSDNNIDYISMNGEVVNYDFDSLERLSCRSIGEKFVTNYEYVTNGKRTTFMIKSISNNGDKYIYKYDNLNNITHIYHNDILENKYYYDNYNQLIAEDNYILGNTIEYQYDLLGNILSKVNYDIDTHVKISEVLYEYTNNNWKDQLTKYNNDIIIYDQIGNPVKIGDDITLSWINGKQLKSYHDANNIIEYKYCKDNMRTSKIVNGVETHYYLEGNNIILEKTNGNVIYYLRNDIDDLIGFVYNKNTYYYVKNKQDDIIGLLDSNYNEVAKYTYDSWGNIISITNENGTDISSDDTHIANINPFRYRSYYYDKETGLYYLNSRYYNPVWGRFLNIDSLVCANQDILSYNLYAYCSNNPINFSDPDGQSLFKKIGNAFKKAGKFVKNIGKTVQKQVDKFLKWVGDCASKIVSVEVNNVQDIVEPAKTGYDVLGTYETGSTVTTSTTVWGNDDSLFKIGINSKNNNIFESTISLSTNADSFNISHEFGIFSYHMEYSANINNRVYSYYSGYEGLNLQMGFTSDVDLGNDITNNYYGQVNVNTLLPVAIFSGGYGISQIPAFGSWAAAFAY